MIKSIKKLKKAKKKYLNNFYFFCLFDDNGSSLEFRRGKNPKININDSSNKTVKAILSTLSNLEFNESVLTCIRQIYLKDYVRHNFYISFLVHDEKRCHFIKYIQKIIDNKYEYLTNNKIKEIY